ncbi:MAG: hypothetical protein Q8Q91_02550 [Candidatus Daviesbacteria bacterium]|nr:hypothetical protein [Candidatus Daviesbacteria bacterium]
MNQKGVIALAAPLLLLLIIAAVLYILISQKIIKNPLKSLPGIQKEPTVSLQTQYQNPFDKNTQYVNPFSKYKNPFDQLK